MSKSDSTKRDSIASSIHNFLNEDAHGPFFVYLRPFGSENIETTESWNFTGDHGFADSQKGPPIVALTYLLEEVGPLVGIGGTSPDIGKVSISNNSAWLRWRTGATENEPWWKAASRFIIHGTAIFINPGTSVSLVQEIKFICDNSKIIRRAFIVMEPTHESMARAANNNDLKASKERSSRWERSRVILEKLRGLAFPKYSSNGAIVSLFDPSRSVSFIGLSRSELFNFMQEFYVDLNKLGSYDIQRGEDCPCGKGLRFEECHGKIWAMIPWTDDPGAGNAA